MTKKIEKINAGQIKQEGGKMEKKLEYGKISFAKKSYYDRFETDEELLLAISEVAGQGCSKIERGTDGDEDENQGDCDCEFCRVWQNPTIQEIIELKRLLPEGNYYWGNSSFSNLLKNKYFASYSLNGGSTYSDKPMIFHDKKRAIREVKRYVRESTQEGQKSTWIVSDYFEDDITEGTIKK